jgi:hypothetical protein
LIGAFAGRLGVVAAVGPALLGLDLLSQHIEGRVLDLVERVINGARVEDFRVECRGGWPVPDKAARQLAGHANAARGEPILWIIGLDENGHHVSGASDVELADWWARVTSILDEGITPGLTPLVVPVGAARSVVALYMTTERSPYLVKRQDQHGPFEREVPWRDGNRTRSAHRHELLRLLVAAVSPPDASIVKLELRAIQRPATEANDIYRTPAQPEHVELNLWGEAFFGQPGGPLAVLPAHLMTGQIYLALDQPGGGPIDPVAIVPTFYPRTIPATPMPRAVEPHPLGVAVRVGDVYVSGPGSVQVTGMAVVSMERRDALLDVDQLAVQLDLPVAGGDRPVVLGTRLGRTEPSDDFLAEWTDASLRN